MLDPMDYERSIQSMGAAKFKRQRPLGLLRLQKQIYHLCAKA
jgi:hypothetical protein